LGHIRLVVIAASVTILAAILWTDILLTRRALRPIDAIVERARRLSESTLAERLPHPDEPGELARLVETLNAMLMRLHDSFEAQRRFTSDAAHELRSPLTRLRTEIEVAMRRPREADEYRNLMSNTLEEIQRLGELTENLLALARLDAGEGRDVPAVATTLDSVVDATVVRFNAVADARGVRLAVATSSAIMVRAMPAVVDVVLANVVDNAVKFSEPGGVVRVQTAVAASHAVITVVDAGPGIPSEELPRVFERFFRGRAPRARGAPGVGLGLAIVKTLVERQHGCVEIDSKPHGGTTVTIRLPLARAMTAAEESA
jgi:two-component system OmpR family sensor kinase